MPNVVNTLFSDVHRGQKELSSRVELILQETDKYGRLKTDAAKKAANELDHLLEHALKELDSTRYVLLELIFLEVAKIRTALPHWEPFKNEVCMVATERLSPKLAQDLFSRANLY